MSVKKLYDNVYKEYKPKVVDPCNLKLKLTTLINNIERSQRHQIDEIIFGLIWLSSDNLLRDKPERLWVYSENKTNIDLERLIPFTRGILDTFANMYTNGKLSNFH